MVLHPIVFKISRYSLAALGLVCMYSAVFLKETTENKIESAVFEWWVRIDDVQKAMRERVATFMRAVASLTARGLDWVFGPKFFSMRMIPLSVYFSLASFFLLAVCILPFSKHAPNAKESTAFLFLIYFLFMGLFPALVRNKWLVALWWAVFLFKVFSFTGLILFVVKTRGLHYTAKGLSLIVLLFACSLACDLGYIALTRLALRHAREIDNPAKILFVLVANALALAIPLVLPIWVGVKLINVAHYAAAMIVASVLFNGIDIVVGTAAFLLAFLLLIHRIAWPLVERPLYAFQRYSPIKNKKWLFGTGVTLITFASSSGKLLELLSKL
jgi:hypothetical protein